METIGITSDGGWEGIAVPAFFRCTRQAKYCKMDSVYGIIFTWIYLALGSKKAEH